PVGSRLGETPNVAPKRLTGAQQTRMGKIEDRPQIGEAVLDRRTSKRNPRMGNELLDGARLLGTWILDCLRLVDDGDPPLGARKPIIAHQAAVARDHEIDVRECLQRHRLEVRRTGYRGMSGEESQRWCEAFDL